MAVTPWLVAAAVACAAPGPANLLLIVIDTCRADRMSLYGYPRATTPELEALAADGVVFEQAITPVSQTLPSLATLVTGTYPPQHGVRVNGRSRLPGSRTTLAELLREEGYATGAIVSAFPLDARFGIDQGFESYDADFRRSIHTRTRRRHLPHPDFEQRADEATDKALAWLRAQREARPARPFFLLVHYFDPHFPYDPPAPYRGPHPYEGELSLTDAEIGRLLRDLREMRLLDATLVVLAGDHGEILDPSRPGAHHAGYLEEAVLRVPLVLRYPERLPARRVPEQVSLVDVAPTILDVLGLPSSETFRGESLLPLIRGDASRVRPWAYFETLYWQLERPTGLARFGLRREGLKYVRSLRSAGPEQGISEELYDLRRDPSEEANLLATGSLTPLEQETLAALRRTLSELLGESARGEPVTLRPDEEQRLRALGYLDPGAEEAGAPRSSMR